ncbi:hypothetical protein AB6A40_006645 [Gnathostoma spinigerum]|uniref:Uncharacterized protein n=1 Tax=Gnathostoma spinigerum TaxID=75299 RepID=A0ABD6EL01_9BILA
MQIWHMEQYPCGDRRLPHHQFPPKMYTPDQLHSMTGVVTYKIDIDDANALKKRISRVKAERNISSTDVLTLNSQTLSLSQKLDDFYEPIARDGDTAYLVMDGSAYYDIEVEEDEWIRISMERGDCIVIPKGVSHRFTLTPLNNVRVQRYFERHVDSAQG